MNAPLMPKATAVWLVENTTLTFEQISEFCQLHPLEVQGIADGDVATGILGVSPISTEQIAADEVEKAEADSEYRISLIADFDKYVQTQKKIKARYTPVARRQDKPDAIAWLHKNQPHITDSQIAKLIGSTKNTIVAIRDKSHWNISNIKPRDPVLLGLCTQTDLHAAIAKAEKKKEAEEKAASKKKAAAK